MQECPLVPLSRDPVADSGQVFNRGAAVSASGTSNNLLGNLMMDVFGEALFLAREPLELPIRGFGSALLRLRIAACDANRERC
jgi:hypothetical protein